MHDLLERQDERLERLERQGAKTHKQASKAAHRGRFLKIVALVVLILLVMVSVWFVHATMRQAKRLGNDLDNLGRIAKGLQFFGISEIPTVTAAAYQAAAATAPTQCHLQWTLLAGIGKVEASHGTYSGDGQQRGIDAAGEVTPAIRGVVLDGTVDGTAVVYDSDGGELDGDAGYDRAVGPMQVLPSTWAAYMPSGSDPQNVNDAARFAASFLCASGDLSDPATVDAAVHRYNNSDVYVADVLQWKATYDQDASATATITPVADKDAGGGVWQEMRDEAWRWWQKLSKGKLNPLNALDPAAKYWLAPSKAAQKQNSSQPTRPAPRQGATQQGQRIADVAMRRVGSEFNAGVAAQCAYFVRDVLDEAGVPVGVTRSALDAGINPGPVGDGEARSFGSDMGEVVSDPNLLEPGDIVEFADTYGTVLSGGGWPAGSITHVGIVVGFDPQEGPMIVDRSTASAPVKYRPLSTFEHFAGAIRLAEKTRSF